MSKTVFRIGSRPTTKDIVGNVLAARDGLNVDRRDLVRGQGRRLKDLMQDEAPKGETGEFAKGIRFKTFSRGEAMGFTVSTPQPLGTWIIKGTKAHPIPTQPRPPGKPLHFYWVGGPRGAGMYTFFGVNHPGTKPNPFPSRAYRRWLPGARSDLRTVASNFSRTITGARQRQKLMGV